ncbi:MAG: SAM-dependent chlorinase/fluorinase [Bacteroidetes bacterium]|nr:SAM-dependent chlorinase/fluorinase [Bacteroidota bacterium]
MALIALLTDFGTHDWYVASMKAVIHRINPGCRVTDISHDITPQDISEGAFILWNVYNYFPAKTIFVSVVDPGVGSARRIILLQTDRHLFLAPDNGLLDYVLADTRHYKAYSVENPKLRLKYVSATFHGRDIFAPAAAYLSRGIRLKEFGPQVTLSKPDGIFIEADGKKESAGRIIYIDRFGNLVTNIRVRRPVKGRVQTGSFTIEKISETFSSVPVGVIAAYMNSSGLLEIGVRDGSAKEVTGAGRGGEVVFCGD